MNRAVGVSPALEFKTRSIADWISLGAARLAEASLGAAGVEHPRLESRLLLGHALTRSAEDLLREQYAMTAAPGFDALIARRAAGEPLAYILGWREFWSLRFRVSPATLIPRPDSETVVEAALLACPGGAVRVLDLGVGTGCLLLAFLHERPDAFGIGIDRSAAAARLAMENARDLHRNDRACFVCGNWADPIGGKFDLLLSNPPYIATADLETLDVSAHEPRAALDGGEDGLAAYRSIVAALPDRLSPNGVAVLELGAGQADPVARIAAASRFRADFRADLAGIPRAIILRAAP